MTLRGNYMDREQRRDALRQHFEEMHAEVDALPPGIERRVLRAALTGFHAAGNAFYHLLVGGGHVQPFSSGDKDEPPGGGG
jgi:hypothetical protein